MNRYITQFKRELWEHKGTLITTPLIILAIFVVLTLFTTLAGRDVIQEGALISHNNSVMSSYSFSSGGSQHGVEYHKDIAGYTNDAMSPHTSQSLSEAPSSLTFLYYLPYVAFDHLAWLLSFIYLLSCLFTDRKDKTILFWKSMPVSEWHNVLTKFGIAVVFLPLFTWSCALAYSVFSYAAIKLSILLGGAHGSLATLWQLNSIIKSAWGFLGSNVATSVWMLPFVGYLLLASSLARKTPILYFALPLLGAVLIEYSVFHTSYVSNIIGSYWNVENPQTGQSILFNPGWHHLLDVVSSKQLWIALLVTVGFLYSTVWLREKRFENE